MAVTADAKRDRQRAIRELIATEPIESQQALAERLAERGFGVTQATVSRDVAELGLARVARNGGHVYVPTAEVAATPSPAPAAEARLRRILADVPIGVGRSGLILLLTGTPGTASIVAQAIDEQPAWEQEGTLAGDNTVLVLFADEAGLERWRRRFESILASVVAAQPGAEPAGPTP